MASRRFIPLSGLWSPPPHPPSRLRPCVQPSQGASRTAKPGLRASGAKRLGTIQATPLPPSCGSFQTFAEALRIFLRAGAPPNVGSTPGLVSECKVGRREGGDVPFEDEGRELQGTATPPAGCALRTALPAPHTRTTGSWRGQSLLFAESRNASTEDRLPPPGPVTTRGSVGPGVMTGSGRNCQHFLCDSAFPAGLPNSWLPTRALPAQVPTWTPAGRSR